MVELKNLRWSPKWVSHLGCIKGCLDYLGISMTDAWLYGGTGHAFIINISEDSCPSGPTAWRTMILFQNGENLGYQIKGIFGTKYQRDLKELQKEAWDFTRKSIDEGEPVYAWEVDIPEFYVVYGYDDIGYYYSDPGSDLGKGPKIWGELGDSGIGLVEVYSIVPIQAKPPTVIIKSAIEAILKHASNPSDWILENYASGLVGYDTWIKGLQTGKANRFGMGYNATVWYECRKYAVEFLQEAKERLSGQWSDHFDQAIEHYSIVSEQLGKVSEKYPWTFEEGPEVIMVDDDCEEVIECLTTAQKAESAGLGVLQAIANAL